MFTKLKAQEAAHQEYKKARRTGASAWAKLAAYLVAASAIIMLAAIFAQTTSSLFIDPTMRNVGIGAAFVVGASSIVFLIFKGKLLKSRPQFIAACVFLGLEFSALTLGAVHTFGTALGWNFGDFITEATKVAIICTFPLVAIEWIVVLALDPGESDERADNHSRSALAKNERETRERLRMSDPVVSVREAAALTEVLSEEMSRLPTEQRALFATVLRNQHGGAFEGIPLFLGDGEDHLHLADVVDQPKKEQPSVEVPADWMSRLKSFLYSSDAQPAQTMGAQGDDSDQAPKGKKGKA